MSNPMGVFAATKKVALVEDDREMRTVLEDFLRMHGLHVDGFPNASEFLVALEQEEESYSLLISDIVMPDSNGMDLLRLLQERNSDLPAIMMTAAPNSRDERDAYRLGAMGYWRKPFPLHEAIVKVQEILGRKAG